MTRDEIEFCERWIELRRPDLQGAVPWDTSRPHAIADNHARGRYWDRALGSVSAGLSDLLELTPRGQDLVASYEAAKETYTEISSTNETFKKIYDHQLAFKKDAYLWMQLSEYTFDTFMMIQQRAGKL